MTTKAYVYSTALIVTTCGMCGIPFAIPNDLYRSRQDDGKSFYCPNGHFIGWKASNEMATLQRSLRTARDNAARLEAERDQIEASRRAWKGQVTRLRKRVIEGDCPLCGQHLRDLERHVARIHPGQSAEITEAEASE